MEVTTRLLELLLAGASREDLDRLVSDELAVDPVRAEELRAQHVLALRVHEQMSVQRGREAELSALYETARDLTAIRDLDSVLAAIVRRARQLLHADMTYLSLNDEQEGASYMKVTDGALTPEFRTLRLPLGTGLLGLVAQSGAPYFTEDYQADARFLHREYIDTAVDGEHIRAILGVPLTVEGTVIGALLAVHRRVRPFPPGEVALLTSFAAHAAVALENARLFEQARAAAAAADEASVALLSRTRATESAAHAHDLLTDVLLHGGGVVEVAEVLAEVLDGTLTVYDEERRLLAGPGPADPAVAVPDLDAVVDRARTSGRCVQTGAAWVSVAAAGEDHLGTLVLRTDGAMDLSERRTLERGALVTALVLLFGRTEAEAESRVRGELLTDLVAGRPGLDPQRLGERARRQGTDLDAPLALVVAEVPGEAVTPRAVAALAGELQGLGGTLQGQVVVLAPGGPLRLGEAVQARLGGATVGVARSSGGVGAVAEAYREACQTLVALLRLGRTGEVSDPSGLGLARLLLGGNGPAELEEFIEGTLGPVLAYDRERDTALVETLDAWFGTGGSLRETADQLHVHPNTVSQRLDRVGLLLGAGWREPRRRLDVQLALQMARLRPDV